MAYAGRLRLSGLKSELKNKQNTETQNTKTQPKQTKKQPTQTKQQRDKFQFMGAMG